jgi:hypothetical protein
VNVRTAPKRVLELSDMRAPHRVVETVWGVGVFGGRIMIRKFKDYKYFQEWLYPMQFACFDCRKVFKQTISQKRLQEHEPFCPQCTQRMWLAGRAFRAPRHNDLKQWRKVEALIKGGVLFHYNSGKRPKVWREVAPFLEKRIGRLETKKILSEIKDKRGLK